MPRSLPHHNNTKFRGRIKPTLPRVQTENPRNKIFCKDPDNRQTTDNMQPKRQKTDGLIPKLKTLQICSS